MKTIRVSDKLHKKIMDKKDSEFTSADLVIGWMLEQEQAFDEGSLLIQILNNVDVLTCINCGERLIDSRNTVKTFDKLGMIHLDPGSSNYPHEPDEPAGIYFECVECMKND